MLEKLQNISKNKLANGLWSIKKNEEVSYIKFKRCIF